MEVIVGNRGSGRTASCIKRASEIGGVVVVATRTRKRCTEKLAESLNCDVTIMTADELFTSRGSLAPSSLRELREYSNKLCIDDSDTLNYIIAICLGFEIDTITLCSDMDNIVEIESSLKLMGLIDD